VTLKNFQCHTDKTFDLSEGVNVFVGKSDSGKTAIYRAIVWVLFNKPSGDAYRTRGVTGDTSVTLTFSDGTITRTRGDSENSYTINGKKYNTIGAGVPEEIERFINMNDVNLCGQFSPPFLLSMSPGEAARYMNGVVNLDVIDNTMKAINKTISSIKTDERACEQNLEKLKGEWQKLSFAKTAKEIANGITTDTQNISKKKETLNQIIDKFNQWDELEESLENVPKVNMKELDDLTSLQKKIENKEGEIDSITAPLNLWKLNERNLKDTLYNLSVAEKRLKEITPETCPLCGNKMR